MVYILESQECEKKGCYRVIRFNKLGFTSPVRTETDFDGEKVIARLHVVHMIELLSCKYFLQQCGQLTLQNRVGCVEEIFQL